MKNIRLLVLICLLFIPLCANAQDSAYQFVSNLYANYQNSASGDIFNKLQTDSIFTPDLLKLIRLDQEYAHGEAGYLDWDPLCDCQDPDGLHIKKIAIFQKSGITYAEINLGTTVEEIKVILQLKHLNGKWLINNIEEKSVPNLREYLEKHLKNKKVIKRYYGTTHKKLRNSKEQK